MSLTQNGGRGEEQNRAQNGEQSEAQSEAQSAARSEAQIGVRGVGKDQEAGMSGEQAVARLSGVIEANRKRWKLVVLLEALGLGVSVTLGYLWLVFIIDHNVHLPQTTRIVSLAVFIACVGWLAFSLVRRWRMFDMTVDQVALAIERRTPGGVGNRLINALQLARGAAPGSDMVARHVVEENLQALENVRLKQARAMKPALARLAVAGALACAGLGMWMLNPTAFNASVARVFDPLGNHDPAYRTRMSVLPGDTQARPGQSVILTISLEGKVPGSVEISQAAGDKRQSHMVRIEPEMVARGKENKAIVQFTLTGLSQTTRYRVSAGDHVSDLYTIEVPQPAQVHGFVSKVTPPEYAGISAQTVESGTGDIEALEGSRVEMVVKTVGTPESLTLRYLAGPAAGEKPGDVPGKALGASAYGLNFAVVNDVAYKIVLTQRTSGPGAPKEQETARYTMRAIADLPARAELVSDPVMLGIGSGQKYKWQVKASDDLGLSQVGFFAREAVAGRTQITPGMPIDVQSKEWQMVRAWPANMGMKKGNFEYVAAMAELGFVDGQEVEIVPAASDLRPDRATTWFAGEPVTVNLGGAAQALEVEYERILKVEARLEGHVKAQEALYKKAMEARKLFHAPDRKDSEAWQKKLAELTGQLAREEAGFGKEVLASMRMMPQSAQHLRASLAMVNDTDVRASVQGMEAVVNQPGPQESLAAYNMAANAMSRSSMSLGEIKGAFAHFRERWEDQNMSGMVKFLADRQMRLRDETKLAAQDPGLDSSRTLAAFKTRQTHVAGLTALVSQGISSVAGRMAVPDEAGRVLVQPEVIGAYRKAGERLASGEMASYFSDAGRAIEGRDFVLMEGAQEKAGAWLMQTYLMIVSAQGGRLQVAMAPETGEKQPAGRELGNGPADNKVTYESIDDSEPGVRKKPGAELGGAKAGAAEAKVNDYKMTPEQVTRLDVGGGAKPTQDLETLVLGEKPSGQVRFPGQSDQEPNQVAVKPQKDVGDVAGAILPEEPNKDPNYDRNHLNTNAGINEPGKIGKQAGDVNSNAGAAATGNNIPPANEIGGTSRDGTKDSRANGRNISKTADDRRGLDKPQEGSQGGKRFPGELKRVRFTDKDVEPAAGNSGSKVTGEDRNHWAKGPDGNWKNSMAQHMGEPDKVLRFVESQKDGSRFDPKVLKQMYVDLEALEPAERERLSKLVQTVKVLRTIQKDLSRVFMAPSGLEEALTGLDGKLAMLEKAQEESDFRTLAREQKIENKGRVGQAPGSAFEQSPGRAQMVRGRVLDEPAWAVLPGYEGVADAYYQKLAEGE